MKKLIKYLGSFIKEDFNPWIYGFAFIFLILAITFNYSVGFEKKVLDGYYKKPEGILISFLFYAFAYYFIAVPKLIVQRSSYVLRNKKFWLKTFLFFTLLGFAVGFSFLEKWIKLYEGYEYYYILNLNRGLCKAMFSDFPACRCRQFMNFLMV